MKFTPKRWATLSMVLALGTLLGCASPAAKEGNKQAAEDAAITGKVIKAIAGEVSLKSSRIVVETSKGVVLLSGVVNSAAAENTATELARYIDGVNLVRDGLQIKP
jgi:osmotically-inducible protein OsmY